MNNLYYILLLKLLPSFYLDKVILSFSRTDLYWIFDIDCLKYCERYNKRYDHNIPFDCINSFEKCGIFIRKNNFENKPNEDVIFEVNKNKILAKIRQFKIESIDE